MRKDKEAFKVSKIFRSSGKHSITILSACHVPDPAIQLKVLIYLVFFMHIHVSTLVLGSFPIQGITEY